ncbi:hypothetical protein TNCV_3687271 [Trichonephila clavipes]|nr:hypothetical protein TNCV_3687271 [Trichonephila clavipes]
MDGKHSTCYDLFENPYFVWGNVSRHGASYGRILKSGLSLSYLRNGGNSQIGETSLFSTADCAKSTDYSSKDNERILLADFGGSYRLRLERLPGLKSVVKQSRAFSYCKLRWLFCNE